MSLAQATRKGEGSAKRPEGRPNIAVQGRGAPLPETAVDKKSYGSIISSKRKKITCENSLNPICVLQLWKGNFTEEPVGTE